MNQKMIKNVYPPQDLNDSATKFYVDSKFLHVNGSN